MFSSFHFLCRCFTIDRYDVSGVPADRIQRILERDWVHLVRELGVLDSPNYLREKGKSVIALWGKILFFSRFLEPLKTKFKALDLSMLVIHLLLSVRLPSFSGITPLAAFTLWLVHPHIGVQG